MTLTFEYWRAGEVLGGNPTSGPDMEYWRALEVHQFFEVAAAPPGGGAVKDMIGMDIIPWAR